jgi:hypothetical protein
MLDYLWALWFLAIVVSFSILEGYAFKHPSRLNTLSRCVWTIGQKWPLSLVLYGMVFGGLAVHFFWNWCPQFMPAGIGG